MKVALKIWRFDPSTGDRALKEYEVDAPDWATLLDVLDIVKDQVDGTLAYRKSCRMMICGSCGMRMDGAALLACRTRMYESQRRARAGDPRDGQPADRQRTLVVDMNPFWAKMRAMKPWLQPGYVEPPEGKEHLVSQERMNVIHKEALCINCGCCVSECNSMESDPDFLGPAALAKGDALRRRRARSGDGGAARGLQRGARDLGLHAVLLLPGALSQGRRPEGCDREARRRGDEARDRPRHGGETREVVRHLGQDDGLAAGDRARAQDTGRRRLDQGDQVRDGPAPARRYRRRFRRMWRPR